MARLLSQSDYAVIKKAEGATLTPNDTALLAKRSAIREWGLNKKAMINNATNTTDLKTIGLNYDS
jgi:dTDP-4-amino-4,6-dideoxygalactose transaminase